MPAGIAKTHTMSFVNPWLLLGMVGLLGVLIWAVVHYGSREAKLGRRRRRNAGRLEPRVNRPMVRLSVRTKRKRK
jgi:hypothetical protein